MDKNHQKNDEINKMKKSDWLLIFYLHNLQLIFCHFLMLQIVFAIENYPNSICCNWFLKWLWDELLIISSGLCNKCHKSWRIPIKREKNILTVDSVLYEMRKDASKKVAEGGNGKVWMHKIMLEILVISQPNMVM